MAINKNKVNDNALKYIQKGQIKKAIREYDKILAEDLGDVRTLLKKGDLLVRVGDRGQAVETYLIVANAYSQQGFHLKAVAVFKQILKIDDSRIDVNLRLAEEYQNLGIVGDAMSHLQIVAGYYDQQGMMRESLDILRRIVDLDPDNIASRIKLAELYSREEMIGEAVEEFQRAAEELKNANRIEDFIKVAERLIYHDPSNIQLIKEVANIYLQRGDTKRALGKLQICFKADPRDLETLNMLAMAFQELGQLSKTVSVHKEMAKIYQEAGDVGEAQEIYRRILEIAPDDAEANQALGAGAEPGPAYTEAEYAEAEVAEAEIAEAEVAEAEVDGADVAAAEPQVTMPTGQQYQPEPAGGAEPEAAADFEAVELDYEPEVAEPMTVEAPRPQVPEPEVTAAAPPPIGVDEQTLEYISRLLTETDVYIKYGLHNKAYEHLNKVFEQDPNNIESHDKLKDLYLAAGQQNHACQELVTLIHLCVQAGRQEQARAYLEELTGLEPNHPDAPGLAAILSQGAPVAPEAAAPDMDAVAVAEEGLSEDEALDVDVSLDFDDSTEFSVDTGEPVDEPSFAEDQFTDPGAPSPESATEVLEIEQPPPTEPVELEADVVPLDDEAADEVVVEETQEADLDDLDDLPGLDDMEALLQGDSSGEFDPGADEEDEELPTRIADVGNLQQQLQGGSAAPEPASSLDDYAAGEDTLDVEQFEMATEQEAPAAGGDGEAPIMLDDGAGHIQDEAAAELDLEPQAEAAAPVIELEAEPEAEPLLEAEPEAEPLLEAEPEAEPLLEAEPEPEAEPLLEAEPEPEAEPLLEAEPEPEAAPAPRPEPAGQPAAAEPELIDFDEAADGFPSEAEPDAAEPDEEVPTQLGIQGPGQAEQAEQAEQAAQADAAEEAGDEDLEDGLEEIDFFIQQNLLDEAADALDGLRESFGELPQIQTMADKLARLQQGEAAVAQVTPEDLGQEFDLAAELEQEVGEEFAAPIDDEFQYSVDDVFSEFKKGVEKVVEKEDSATHFDLGIAYREMGLTDDAITEFSVAAQDESRRSESLTLIGLCMVEKEQYSEAINRFKDALHSAQIGEEQATGLYYEMGDVYERLQDLKEALFYFKKVYKRNPKFRDVTARLKSLIKAAGLKKGGERKSADKTEADESATGSGGKSANKDKISYM